MVKAGYKETEIGVIPAEWDFCSIERDFDFYPNNTYARDCMNDASGAVRNIHYGDVLIKYGSILDCERDNIPFINLGIPVNTANRMVQSGDIIMADTAEDETVGKAIEVINVGSKKIVSGLHTFFLRPHADLFAPRYLGYFIDATVYHNQLLPHIVGTKVSSVSKKSLNETIILHPPLLEQRRIAEAISDVDTLISNLEKLITKKKAIKQGTMQLLLTGKKRLPGFTDKWSVKAFEVVGDFFKGSSVSMKDVVASGYPCIMYGDIYIKFDTHFEKCDYHITAKTAANSTRAKHGDLFFTESGETAKEIGKCVSYQGKDDIFIGGDIIALRPYEDYDSLFLAYVQNSAYLINQKASYAQGCSVVHISSDNVKKLTFASPTLLEQKRIAEVLFDMDTEILELEKKLSKYCNIKTGMMHTLLTGKIRLTEQAAPAVVIPFSKAETPPKPGTKPHNQQFDDAVAIAAIVDAFYSGKYPLGRKKVQKLLYLLRRRQDASIAAFKKKAAGPYADEVRYKGGEPIATRNSYITVNKSNQGSMFSKGKSIQKALEYVAKWEMQPDVDWLVAQFLHTKVDTLELLATIDMAMCDLEKNNITVLVDSVKKLIASDKEWRAKLKKTYFSDDDIGWAITECLGLFNTTGR